MARTLQNIHDLVNFIARKSLGAFIPPADIDAALTSGQIEKFKECYLAKDYDAIEPFKLTNVPLTSSSTGVVTFPADYEYHKLIFVGTTAAPTPIRTVKEEELPDAIKSQLRPVSIQKPIGVHSAVGMNIYPESTYLTKLTYYRTPANCVYAYTQAGRVITYDNATSVQLEFQESYWDSIVAKSLPYLGIYLADDEIIKLGQYKEATA